MFRTTAVRAALLALALTCAALSTSTASAATVTVQPSPAEARTFATTNGGWSSAVDYNGLVCIPGVTCPSANPSYQATNGAGGAGDGYLRDSFGTLLGVLSTTTISWSSPTFVAPAATTSASLSVSVRPQIASLLAIGSVRLTPSLVDVADPTQTTVLPDVPLTAASSSFSAVNVTVPPAAVASGRTYRIRLAVSLNTAVSAVTSGTVDLDNVVLTLTNAVPPSGLTATVPASGATRVTGSVNAEGQNTDVTVDYGPTNTYGTTTSPVTINGSTSGSQPFSIPLTGLTAGATYHYRVNATNPDGTVQTTDGTFVAASAPSTDPPTVTGANTSPTRTVTFTRAPDVTSASVELLNSGGTVIDTYPDSDNDGSVSITLPADGSYSVRVVRTNADSISSTSTSVPVLLDRVGPDTSGLNLTVTPTASSAAQRTVSFTRPADATTVTAQVIDASNLAVGLPVTAIGGSATVTIGPSDGAYRVRLTLTDASGNSTQATSSAVTLDTVAPDAGPAPTVTGADNSRNRTVTFTRSPDAATVVIEILDGSGVIDTIPVPSGSTSPITLPNTDGNYGVRVKQTDAAGNSGTSPGTSVVLDTTAPDAGPAPTVTGASNSRNRTVTFTRAPDAATVVVEVLDGSGVIDTIPVASGNTTPITLPDTDGSYGVRVKQTDAAGNSATSPGTPILLDRVGPDVSNLNLTVTPTASSAAQRTVSFTRPADAATVTAQVIDASDLPVGLPVTVTGGSGTVTLGISDGAYRVRLTLTDASGNSAQATSSAVTLDTVGPDAGPAPTVTGPSNDRDRTVTFTRAPDATTVVVEILDGSGVIDTIPVPSGNTTPITLPNTDGNYGVRVKQTDAAGNSDTTPGTSIVLDRSAPDLTTLNLTLTPSLSNDRARDVSFVRPGDAATVSAQVIDASGDPVGAPVVIAGSTGTVTLGTTDGAYRVVLTVTDAAGNSDDRTSTAVTLDTAAPDAGPAPTVTGANTDRDRTATFTRAPDAATVVVEVLDSGGTVIDTIPVASGNSADVTLPNSDGSYGVRVKQTDAAGNSATTPTKTITLDRSAPDLSALALTVTPAVSNDQSRTVSFVRPGDADVVTAQVIDANGDPVGSPVTVTGSTGTVTLGSSDGAYRVVLTVADASGNSDDRTSSAVTLDTAAPDAGPAPTVTGAGNSRNRTVTFTRASDAANVTVELLDGGGNVVATFPVASGGSTPITLPDTDGSYRVRVKQADAAGNSATTPTTPLTLDRSGPDAGPAPVVTGEPDDLTVTFVRAPDAVSATIEVRDANGTLVATVPVPTGNSGTVQLPAANGEYTIRVVQVDADGNSGTTPSTTVERKPAVDPGGGGGTPSDPPAGTPPVTDPPKPPVADPPKPPVVDVPTRCSKPSLVLTKVALHGGKVQVSGWTAEGAGTKVGILDQKRKQVGTATADELGDFTATVRPGAGVKRTALGYYAAVGSKRSIGLKLNPANTLTSVVRTGTTITIHGRVDRKRVGTIRSVDAIGGTGDCPGTSTSFKPLGKPTVNRRTGTYTLKVTANPGGRLIVRSRVTGTHNRARSGYLVR